MTGRRLAACMSVMLLSAPALAQAVDPHQPRNDGSAADSMTVAPGDVAPGRDPATRAANLGVGQAPVAAAENAQSAYQTDLSRYDQTVHARHRAIAAANGHYAHQRQAYAQAMQAWRGQVAACHAGDGRACRAPTPDPAAFY